MSCAHEDLIDCITEGFVGWIQSIQEMEVGSHYHFGGDLQPEVTDKTSKGCPDQITRSDLMKVRSELKWVFVFHLPPAGDSHAVIFPLNNPPVLFRYSLMGYSKVRATVWCFLPTSSGKEARESPRAGDKNLELEPLFILLLRKRGVCSNKRI